MNKELIELREKLIDRREACLDMEAQTGRSYYAGRADAFCTAICEIDAILQSMKEDAQ